MKDEIDICDMDSSQDKWLFTESELEGYLQSVPDRQAEEEQRIEICSFIRQLGIDIRV